MDMLEIKNHKAVIQFDPELGMFNVSIPSELHAKALEAAAARGMSLNDLVHEALTHELGKASF